MPVEYDARSGSWTVKATVPVGYGVHMADSYFIDGDPRLILGGEPEGHRMVVIDANVHRLHWEMIGGFFLRHGIRVTEVKIAAQEATKLPQEVLRIAASLGSHRIDRRTEPIIAIGGGVLTDMAGFAAAMLSRGTPWVRVVTSGQMWDAGTSVKVGCNAWQKKSALGGFHPPVGTIVDRTFLWTLPKAHLVDAVAEIAKVGLIMAPRLWAICAEHGPSLIAECFQPGGEYGAVSREAIWRTVQGSLEDNAPNLFEHDLDRRMHLGHTWGALWEMRNKFMHGQGVALDMALTAALSEQRGMITRDELGEVIRGLRALGLPTQHEEFQNGVTMREATEAATRARAGKLRAPLLDGIGGCAYASDITQSELMEAGRMLNRWAA